MDKDYRQKINDTVTVALALSQGTIFELYLRIVIRYFSLVKLNLGISHLVWVDGLTEAVCVTVCVCVCVCVCICMCGDRVRGMSLFSCCKPHNFL